MKSNQKKSLLAWYQQNFRPLPWRKTRDPYLIWISEVMLQQTTSQAVIPYFEAFKKRFPTIKDLANAPLGQLYQAWSGLGYYSRARNLHKAAKAICSNKQGFPKHEDELIQLPGFGPYTSRSVASLAFDRPVGVLDGNVIRLLSRYHATPFAWWKTQDKKTLQNLADKMVIGLSSAQMNQAMMELGATICLPKNPKCLLCPLMSTCEGQKTNRLHELPLSRPRKEKQLWLWQAQLQTDGSKLKLIQNNYAPFLKNTWFLPGKAQRLQTKPKQFDFRHTITHHDIYVQVSRKSVKLKSLQKTEMWTTRKDSKKYVPASLVQKALQHILNDRAVRPSRLHKHTKKTNFRSGPRASR